MGIVVGCDDTTAKGPGSTRVMREPRASTEESAEPVNQGCDLENYRSLDKSDPMYYHVNLLPK